MFSKGSLRTMNKSGWGKSNSAGNYFNFEQYDSRESAFTPYDEITKQKENDGENIINNEYEEFKKNEEKINLIKKQAEIERKKREPQPMDIDSVPSDAILEPPKKEEEKKEVKFVQKQDELGTKRVYYTQIIK